MELVDEMSLVDIWRVRNPDQIMYSWMRNRPRYIASRIDYALVTQGLADKN